MSVQLAYMGVIAIWSTTPLAIKLSSDSVAPLASLSLRIAGAMLGAIVIGWWFRGRHLLLAKNWRIYLVASLGIFPNMSLVYLASQYIPSGLIAILFGLIPFVNGLLALPLLGQSFLSPSKLVAIGLSLTGLTLVFYEQLQNNPAAYTGIALMMGSNLLFSISSLLLKKMTEHQPVQALEQTIGSMAFALPGLLLSWWLLDGSLDIQFSETSLWSLLYLTLFGSLLGFFAYFHILKHMEVATISLIPLITPILAVFLGAGIADEPISAETLMGTAIIVVALGLYQGSLLPMIKSLKQRLQRRLSVEQN